jgi:hypothetical protein
MSGAEALAVVGIIANVIALVDFSSEVLRRVEGFTGKTKDVPKAFQSLKTVLPLIGTTLNKTKTQIDAHSVDEKTCGALRNVVKGCEEQLVELKALFEKILPKNDAGWFENRWKAVASLRQDKKIAAISVAIERYVNVLTMYYAEAAALTPKEVSSITTSISGVRLLDASETGDTTRSKGLCLLSLDGGGVRGLSILLILREIMVKVNEGQPTPQEPWEIFDMIGGTGTGGQVSHPSV